MWPDLSAFADADTAYYQAVLEVGQRLLRAFAAALARIRTFVDLVLPDGSLETGQFGQQALHNLV